MQTPFADSAVSKSAGALGTKGSFTDRQERWSLRILLFTTDTASDTLKQRLLKALPPPLWCQCLSPFTPTLFMQMEEQLDRLFHTFYV